MLRPAWPSTWATENQWHPGRVPRCPELMEIQDLDPARVDEVVAMLREAHRHDLPDDPAYAPRFEKLRILNPFPDEPGTHYVAGDGGRIVGHAELTLPHLDNRTNAILDLTVRPSARRRGVGRRLWEHVAELARSDGRKLIFFDAKMGSPGVALARAIGGGVGIFLAPPPTGRDGAGRGAGKGIGGPPRGAGG